MHGWTSCLTNFIEADMGKAFDAQLLDTYAALVNYVRESGCQGSVTAELMETAASTSLHS
jgi:hypothetical protein